MKYIDIMDLPKVFFIYIGCARSRFLFFSETLLSWTVIVSVCMLHHILFWICRGGSKRMPWWCVNSWAWPTTQTLVRFTSRSAPPHLSCWAPSPVHTWTQISGSVTPSSLAILTVPLRMWSTSDVRSQLGQVRLYIEFCVQIEKILWKK